MLTGRAPYAIGVILIVAFLLLLIVFRSLVIAITSIIAFGITGPIPPTELGLTLAMAVLLDAT